MIQELTELGLSEEEAKVYLAALELGGSYVSTIAAKAGIQRVNCYYLLDKLIQKGLVKCFEKGKIKYYSVESPRVIVEREEEKLGKAKKLLPQLLSITNTLAYKPKIEYYEGVEGIKNIFQDSLKANKEILGYTNLEAVTRLFSAEYIREYAAKKIAKGIKTRMLSPVHPKALTYLKTYYPKGFDPNLVEIFFINPKEFMFEYEINIYENKVGVMSLNPKEPIGVMIEGAVYARTQKAIFDLAWLGATSFVAR